MRELNTKSECSMTTSYLKYCNIITLLVTVTILFCGCASNLVIREPATIEVKHQKIYLQPIKGQERLESCEFWPDSIWQRKFLVENIQQVWKNLLAEFRRCEKYGLYTMVDSVASSTVEITPEIISSRIQKDTLFIPLRIQIFYKADKRSNAITIDAYGLFESDTSEVKTVNELVSAFADYRRRFPYKKVVASFYSQ